MTFTKEEIEKLATAADSSRAYLAKTIARLSKTGFSLKTINAGLIEIYNLDKLSRDLRRETEVM